MVERIGVGRDESESGGGRVRVGRTSGESREKPNGGGGGCVFLGRAEVRGEGVSWQSPFRGGRRWCVVVVTLGWYVPRPPRRAYAASPHLCRRVLASPARGRDDVQDVDAVPRAMDVLRDPSEDHGRLGGGAAVDGNEEHARVPPPFGPRRGDWRRGRRRGVGRLPRALAAAVARGHGGRAGRCASGILDARRVWSRAGHVVPVEYLYQV